MEKTSPDSLPHCLNCQAPLSAEAQFCATCGQKRTTGRVTFKQLASDFFDNVFNLDSRVFLTFRKLLVPGYLTEAYFNGRHKTFLHPFRIFLIAVITMVAAISWMFNDGITRNGDMFSRMSNARVKHHMMEEVDSLNQLYKEGEGESALSAELDSLKAWVYKRDGMQGDSVDLDRYFTLAGEDFPPMQIDDAFNLEAEELAKKYGIEGVKRNFILKQKVKVMKDSRSFLRFLLGRISWQALILIPLMALVLKLFYWRRPFYYVEHFIFSIHTHSVFFILLAIQLLVTKVAPLWTIAISATLMGFYLLFAMHRFYKQSWFKTSVKFVILTMMVYWLLITLSMTIAIILGIILF